jgi:uncharacterized protein YjaZ
MEVKRYDEDKHGEIVTDDLHLEPGEDFGKLQTAVNDALEDIKSVHGVEPDFDIVAALTDRSEYDEDVDPAYFFMGLSLREGMRGVDRKTIFVRGLTEFDDWENRFKDMLVHEIGHQVFYQGEDNPGRDQHYSIRFEGHAENFASQVSEEKNYGYRPPWRTEDHSKIEADPEQIIEDLETNRQWPDEAEDLSKQMFVSGGERYPNAEGYTIAYQVVKELTENEDIKLSDLPGTSKEKWVKHCEKTIRKLYE